MSSTNEPWFVAERSEALAGVLLTSRKDVRVRDERRHDRGLEFLVELRQMPNGDQPVVVFCTTENDIAHIQAAIGAGANEYIMKPFDSDIIHAKFAQVGLL